MQETHNNCFGSKKCSTTLCQAKINKHECRNVAAMYVCCCYISALVLTYFRLIKSRAIFFLTRNNCCEFLASYFQVLFSKWFSTTHTDGISHSENLFALVMCVNVSDSILDLVIFSLTWKKDFRYVILSPICYHMNILTYIIF